MWANERLFIFVDKYYVEYPPVAKRRLIIERTHFDYSHIGAAKMSHKISQEYYWDTIQ